MKNSILQNWNLFRIVRLILGIAIAVQGILAKDILFALAGLLFASLALFNAGCCAGGSCYPTEKKDQSTAKKEIEYEEVVK